MRLKLSLSIKTFALFCAIVLFASSCKKDDTSTVSTYGKLQVAFSNEVDGQPINIGAMAYTNAAGNQYRVDLLKYYVTNFTLIKEDGSQRNFKNYNLIDASDVSTTSFTLDSVSNGNYTSIKFYLGVDSGRNHTGAQDGALDPINGMIWTWNTGYIFFKHEGGYKDNMGVNQSLLFHFGTDEALTSITIPVSKFEVKSDSKKLFLKFNLNKAYASPAQINFNADNNHMSSSSADRAWIGQMKSNFPNAFLFDKVQ